MHLLGIYIPGPETHLLNLQIWYRLQLCNIKPMMHELFDDTPTKILEQSDKVDFFYILQISAPVCVFLQLIECKD